VVAACRETACGEASGTAAGLAFKAAKERVEELQQEGKAAFRKVCGSRGVQQWQRDIAEGPQQGVEPVSPLAVQAILLAGGSAAGRDVDCN
jgi:hypothetical protein